MFVNYKGIKKYLTKKNVFLAVFVLLCALIFIKNNQPDTPTMPTAAMQSSQLDEQPAEELGVHTVGESKTGVVLTEYGDFQSPAGKVYGLMVQQVMNDYGDKLQFIYRDLPVASSKNSMLAQRVANVAEMQGKFWTMHQLLYERQEAWRDSPNSEAIFELYASEIGIDEDMYKRDLASATAASATASDIKQASQQNISVAPTLLIDGKSVPPNIDLVGLKQLIDAAIAANTQSS